MKTYITVLLYAVTAFSLFAERNLTANFNPGFEEGFKYWYFFRHKQGGTVVKGKGVEQSSALVFSSSSKPAEVLVYRKGFVPVKPGMIYTVEAKFSSRITHGYAALHANLWSSAINNQQAKKSKMQKAMISKITESTGDRWSSVRLTFKVPENINGVHIGFSASGLRGEVIFDDVKVFQVTEKNEIPLLSNAPALNGKIDPEFIKRAAKLTDFIKFKSRNKAPVPDLTEAYIAMTTEALHGQILLYHDKKRPVKIAKAPHDTLDVFKSDCIEFFITYTGREAPYHQICINAAGSVYDTLGMNGLSWESGIKTAVGKVSDNCYLIAFSLPLKNIGYNHLLDKGLIIPSWKMNITRNHVSAAVPYSSSWKALQGSFHDIQLFDWFVGMGTRTGIIYSDCFHCNELISLKLREKKQAFWPVDNKEYESLFSGEYSPFKGQSAFIWDHPVSTGMINFALQYGFEYSTELIINEYKKANLLPYVSYYGIANNMKKLSKYAKETQNGFVLYFPYMDFQGNFACIYNPVVRKQLLDWTRNHLKNNPGIYWGVSLGDEATEHFARHLINALNDPRKLKKDPYLRAAAKEIREKYGYGKYGAPSSPKAKERFQWIAVKKYVFDKTLEIQKELFKISREFKRPNGKPLVCISADPIGGLNILQNQTREKDYCDIFTAQCLPQYSAQLQTISFSAKILRDMTGKTVWPCVHFEPYYYSHDAETTAAYLSEVARGGGSGIQIWNSDYVGKVRKMGCSEIDYYGHRPRWDTMLDIVKRFNTMPLLKYPEPDYACYLSNETVNSYWAPLFQDCEALFTLLGPSAQSWFKFICGNQLVDKETDLKKWKVIFIAKADIELPENQQKFIDFVKNGGTLICFDPNVFSYAPDGCPTGSFRELLFGAKTVKSDEVLFSFTDNPYNRNITKEKIGLNPGYALKPIGNTEVLAMFMNRSAAVTMKRYPGGGKAILFASAMKNSYIPQKEWKDLIGQLLHAEGIKTGHKIWNFNFPYKKEVKPVIKGKCYTNNHFYWWLNEPVTSANIKLPGAYYTYNIAPDDTKELKFDFAKGRLTNRIFALTAGDLTNRKNRSAIKSGKLSIKQFADTWIDEETLKINFHFKKKVPISKIVIYYTGNLPGVSAVFPNGKTYRVRGKSVTGVEKLELNIPETVSDSVEVVIDQRILGEKITISEIEIFGNYK
ncbi:MAG: hypothetical protein IKB25_10925 [Lentisphaeria bacterium]|nr:hypothetical protein [Lentisphaeria bacterium]